MIGAFWAIVSLNLSALLVQSYDVVAGTLPITNATVTTPIAVTSTNHGVPLGRVLHGIVSNVTGTVEANGLWVLTPTDPNTFALSTYTPQGIVSESVGVNAYISGGQIQYALPDGAILLGMRNLATATAAATPRFVVVPTDGRGWNFEPYGSVGPNLNRPQQRGTAEQQTMHQQPQLATDFTTFQVFVTGSGPDYGGALAPDFADFDSVQALVHALYCVLFDAVGGLPRARILRTSWPSQADDQAGMSQRGQQWMGILEIQQPIVKTPLAFAPIGVTGQFTVQPGASSGDAIVIEVT
jgi:hypothetical protein